MPQLDINAFLPILFCLLICYLCLFLGIYLFLFLPFINFTKIRLVWQQKQLLSVYLLYVYMQQASSYGYTKQLLKTLQTDYLHNTFSSSSIK